MTEQTLVCASSQFLPLAEDLLQAGHPIRFRARGGSMYPFLRDGDVLVVETVDGRRLHRGDVLLLHTRAGELKAHRLVRVCHTNNESVLRIKGDSSARFDHPVGMSEVVGRIVGIECDGRRVDLTRPVPRLLGWLWAWFSPWSGSLQRYLARHRWLLVLVPRP